MTPEPTRLEHDLLGEAKLPASAYYGIQTQRALENFRISGVTLRFFPEIIQAHAEVKKACAIANHQLGMLDTRIKTAILHACDDLIGGQLHDQFKVDTIQGGAGTSTNMNANEVIANRALEHLGHQKGEYQFCHPNNHVNLSQSTNDVYPTATKLALLRAKGKLLSALNSLIHSMRSRAVVFAPIIKIGRTQLQDAVPMSLGQTFEAYAVTLEEEIERIEHNAALFLEVNLGGTAIGTGINTTPEYADLAIAQLRLVSGYPVVRARDLIESTQDAGPFIMFSSALKRLAVKLSKICNDLRLLSSGPRAGFGEINLPPMQPGSSIMPGKVNPVIPEVVNQVAFKVIGNDLTVNLAVEAGQLELNAFEPIMAHCLFESINMLTNGMTTLRLKCVDGITANEKRCQELVRRSISIVTALNPLLGYETCTALSKEALETDQSIYDLVLAKGLLTEAQLSEALAPENLIRPQLRRVS